MKTINKISIIIIFIIGTIGYSQEKSNFSIGTSAGYEYNYFRSPEEVRRDGVLHTGNDLISSSVYQDIRGNYGYTNKIDRRNRIRLSAGSSARVFYQNLEDSYWRADLRGRYDHKLNKKMSLLAEARFIRMARKGLGGDEDVLVNPLGYLQYGFSGGIDIEPVEQFHITANVFYNFRNYDSFGDRDLQYDEFGLRASAVHTFENRDLKHSIGVDAYIKKRLYDTFDASDDLPNGIRNWDYAKATLFYELPLSKNFEVEPSFSYYTRVDNIEDRSGFNQYGPGISLNFDNSITKISSSLSYMSRVFSSREARDNDGRIGENIKNNTANFGLDASHEINDNWSITATIFSRIRTSNNTDIDRRSFRAFKNQYAGVGVLWQL
ncbi:hypothetical protein [Aquimarina algicola]|uniref:DUF2860 domain-containing protein n=1 Tax=Aquimarina algicola TaxID=2589995 RepID=A0A504JAK7_9FLAO|nr:hypothetical protein [Aquimarina algicola]TPN87937.1 hypothetical protein FHK87_10210 [Aquimarina algicola]